MRRIAQLVGYTFSVIGILLLILWAIRGARPALDCGLVDAVSAQDWGAAYTCLDESDYDPLIGFVTLISGGLLALAARFAGDGCRCGPEPRSRPVCTGA